MIEEFSQMQLLNLDAKGRSSDDRHYFGLVGSLEISMRRMMAWCDRHDSRTGTTDTKKMVVGLLMAISMLDRTRTPKSLFQDLVYRSCSDPEHGTCGHTFPPPIDFIVVWMLYVQVPCYV